MLLLGSGGQHTLNDAAHPPLCPFAIHYVMQFPQLSTGARAYVNVWMSDLQSERASAKLEYLYSLRPPAISKGISK
jgi:hypothetical protein